MPTTWLTPTPFHARAGSGMNFEAWTCRNPRKWLPWLEGQRLQIGFGVF
jgi:hypothetical protein